MATLMGLEPTTFAVTGRRSNQLSYSAKTGVAGSAWWARLGSNQRPPACEADALPLSYAPVPVTAPWTKPNLTLPSFALSSTKCGDAGGRKLRDPSSPSYLAAVVAVATSVHLPVSTTNPQAQAAVDRGLFLYYAYNGDDAARSFERSRRPRSASGDGVLGRRAGKRARSQHADDGGALRARARSDPAGRRACLGHMPAANASSLRLMGRRYRGELRRLAGRTMPRIAKACCSSARESATRTPSLHRGGGARRRRRAAVAAPARSPTEQLARSAGNLLRDVLRDDPDECDGQPPLHPPLRPRPESHAGAALRAAARCRRFPSEAEHLAHMPAHYWIETGDYPAALASSDRAFALLEQLREASTASTRAVMPSTTWPSATPPR